MSLVRLLFVVDDKRDTDILQWWRTQENRSESVRDLIRRDIGTSEPTIFDVFQKLHQIEQIIKTSEMRVVFEETTSSDGYEPKDVAERLDKLGL